MTIWIPTIDSEQNIMYLAIAHAIRDDIASGKLSPGQRLPTQRALAKALSVTVGTIGRAYAFAARQGLVSLETGRGTFVKSFRDRTHLNEGPNDIIDLGLNLPSPSNYADRMTQTLAEISCSKESGMLFGCGPINSQLRYRQAAVSWFQDRTNCTTENVVICSGTQNALISALGTIAKPGDRILVDELTFPGIIESAKLLHLKLVAVPMDKHGIIPSELERLGKHAKALYCVPTNQNPTTITLSESRRKSIARLAAKQGWYVIEDDVYSKLMSNTPAPIASWLPKQTFLISSVAKTLCVGLRLAMVKIPDQLIQAMSKTMRATQFFPAPLLCEVAARWIEGDLASTLIAEQQENSKLRAAMVMDILDSKLIRGKPNCNHIWLRLPDAWTTSTFSAAARESGVHLLSSESFYVGPKDAPPFVRIAFGAARNDRELKIGLTKLAALLTRETYGLSTQY